MKSLFALMLLGCTYSAMAQKEKTATLKSILLKQLKTTHNVKDWFVPVNAAIAGLTAEQANWKDSTGNHSIASLLRTCCFGINSRLINLKA